MTSELSQPFRHLTLTYILQLPSFFALYRSTSSPGPRHASIHINVARLASQEAVDVFDAHINHTLARLQPLPPDVRCKDDIVQAIESRVLRKGRRRR